MFSFFKSQRISKTSMDFGPDLPSRLVIKKGVTLQRPLIELINLALCKDTLEDVICCVDEGKSFELLSPVNEGSNIYLAKILREEVEKQFSEPMRPLLELVLNAADAKLDISSVLESDSSMFKSNSSGLGSDFENVRKVAPFRVDVHTGLSFSVRDGGRGMSLCEILKLLLIPFNTEKDPLQDIGRFGVGFFSALQYCLHQPKSTVLQLMTSKEGAGHYMQIYSTGPKVEDLVCTLQRAESQSCGTHVKLKGHIMFEKDFFPYAYKYLHFFDTDRAQIYINNKLVNTFGCSRSDVSKPAVNTSPKVARDFTNGVLKNSTVYDTKSLVQLEYQSYTMQQPIRVAINVESGVNHGFFFYSQGVFVERIQEDLMMRNISIHIDLPSIISLVEGRDEVKKDANFKKCLQETLKHVIIHTKNSQHDSLMLGIMREALPQFFEYCENYFPCDEEFGKEALAAAFPTPMYFVPSLLSTRLTNFVDSKLNSLLYVPRSSTAEEFWQPLLMPYSVALEKSYTLISTIRGCDDFRSFVMQRFPQLSKDNFLFTNPMFNSASFYRFDWPVKVLEIPEPTISPLLLMKGMSYLNINHFLFSNPSYITHYGLLTSLLGQKTSQKDMENMII